MCVSTLLYRTVKNHYTFVGLANLQCQAESNFFCLVNIILLFFVFCVPTDGSLPKEPKGDVSSQIAGKTNIHTDVNPNAIVPLFFHPHHV